MTTPNVAALVVGAGPAGLAAARTLADADIGLVLVVERDDEPGGLPRFCHHPGFGWEYSHRLESGPAFARRMLGALDPARVRVLARTTALAVRPGPEVDLVGPDCGAVTLKPGVVVLATGIRERPRAARLTPGRRPEHGVLTTGQFQQMVARGVPVDGRRAVVVGTEHVAFSVLLTARRAGLAVVAMIESADRVMSFAALGAGARWLCGIPTHLSSRVVDIAGNGRVEAVVLAGPDGETRIACDTVIFSGDFIPDAPLARASGLAIDPRTGGPVIDQLSRTSLPGVFAAGNLLRAVESSGLCAIEGARAGAAAAAFLAGRTGWTSSAETIGLGPDFLYLVPQLWDFAATGAGLAASLRARSDGGARRCVVRHGDDVVWRSRRQPLLRLRRMGIDLSGLSGRAGRAGPIAVEVVP